MVAGSNPAGGATNKGNNLKYEIEGTEAEFAVDTEYVFAGLPGQEVDANRVLTIKYVTVNGKVFVHDSQTDELFSMPLFDVALMVEAGMWLTQAEIDEGVHY